jgi:hypothetical protein
MSFASVALTACQTYEAARLNDSPDLLSEIVSLKIAPTDLPLPELGSHPFDPSRPLDMDEVAMIAVVNNPVSRRCGGRSVAPRLRHSPPGCYRTRSSRLLTVS